MKKVGYLMITIAFLTGALASVIDKSGVRWNYFAPSLVLGALGVAIVHFAKQQHDKSEERLSGNLQNIKTSLTSIVKNIANLNKEKQLIDPYDVRHHIDELFADDLAKFVEARQSLATAYGLQVYADVMSHFASAERYLNRVWSASADGYIDEINTYLDKAQIQFTEALDRVNQLKNSIA